MITNRSFNFVGPQKHREQFTFQRNLPCNLNLYQFINYGDSQIGYRNNTLEILNRYHIMSHSVDFYLLGICQWFLTILLRFYDLVANHQNELIMKYIFNVFSSSENMHFDSIPVIYSLMTVLYTTKIRIWWPVPFFFFNNT